MRPLRTLLCLLLAATLAVPAFAYTIYLKDGSRIIAQERYEVVDGKAILVLQNGTQVSYDASLIDVERTRRANANGNYGTAVIFEDGKAVESATPPAERPATLSDLIQRRGEDLRGQPGAQRDGVITGDEAPAPARRAGSAPAPAARRAASTAPETMNAELAGELRQYFRTRGLNEVAVFRGSAEGSALVQVTTASEGAVFRSLAVGAKALQDIGERQDVGLDVLELAMATPSGENAGRFSITPEMADELISKQSDVTSFYLRYVQF